MISIGSTSAAQAFQTGAAARAAAPAPAPAPTEAPASYQVQLDIPGDADPCTDCGRDEIQKAYETQALEQGSVDADVIAQVAATYAASRLVA